jgi:hypothetical protein
LLQLAACSSSAPIAGSTAPFDPSQPSDGTVKAPPAERGGGGGRNVRTDAGPDATDAGPTSEADAGSPATIRFLALGDGGEGNDIQYRVGETAARICAERGCDFALYLGDNFYNSGVASVDDEQFSTKFELPYAGLDIPFYVVLGNHDYGEEGLGIPDSGKRDAQIAYTERSDKWNLPAAHYTVRVGPVQLFGLDTPAMMWGRDVESQAEWLADQVAQSDASWKIAFGHHPYRSNGQHGNAGNYDGVPFVPFLGGAPVRDFMEDSVCGNIDVYFAGHDHTRQWLEPACGTELIVSGAAAKLTPLEHRDNNPTHYEDDSVPGFMWAEIQGNRFHGVFFDQDGNVSFDHEVTR